MRSFFFAANPHLEFVAFYFHLHKHMEVKKHLDRFARNDAIEGKIGMIAGSSRTDMNNGWFNSLFVFAHIACYVSVRYVRLPGNRYEQIPFPIYTWNFFGRWIARKVYYKIHGNKRSSTLPQRQHFGSIRFLRLDSISKLRRDSN